MPQGIKNFAVGEVLTSGDVDGYLMQQTVPVFASVAAADAAYTAAAITPTQGMYRVTIDTDTRWYYDGTVWQADCAAGPTDYSATTATEFTNLTVGNGDVVSDIQNVGLKQLRYKGQITLGSTSAITGSVTLSVPAGLTSAGTPCTGHATYNDVGTRLYCGQVRITPGDTEMAFIQDESGTGLLSASLPFTWAGAGGAPATGDVLGWDITIGIA